MGLGSIEASQEDDSEGDKLLPDLEEAIERGGELSKELIIVDDKEVVPDQCAQKLDLPPQALQSPPPSNDPMMEDTKPTQPTGSNVDGT